MTKRELYKRVKAGAEYGRKIESIGITIKCLWSYEPYIYFENYGRTACRANYKDFAETFSIMFGSVKAFLKENNEL